MKARTIYDRGVRSEHPIQVLQWISLGALLLLVLFPMAMFGSSQRAGYVDRLDILSTYPAYGGASFGTVGPYVVIVGIVYEKIDPSNPANSRIVDLDLAPRDSNGLVSYSEDFVILRPKNAASAKRVLFYDVVNRGNKVATGTFNGGGTNFSAGQQGNALLLRLGYTLVWSGWQGNVAETGKGDTGLIGASFPTATNPDGSAIKGQTRQEFILDALDASNGPGLGTNGIATVTLTYPAATTDPTGVTFNWRQTWRTPQGMEFTSPSTPVPAASWSYVNNGTQVQFTPPAGSDQGSIFTFIYTAENPTVNGLGFAGIRDLITFLNYDSADAQGNPNPLSDLKTAPCETQQCDRTHNFELTLMEGISQSGRFVRDFLWHGFNYDATHNDANDHSHAVFNGMFPIIPASRKTYTDFRWSQPFRWSKEHEDHWQPGDQFPFAYQVITDPLTGISDGILKQCELTQTCPKIIQLDGGFEYFGGRAKLVSSDGRGHDLQLPKNVRLYVVPGANHGGGAGVAAPSQSPLCKYPSSIVVESTIDRGLTPVLEKWVARGVEPPPSEYPAGDLLAPPTDQAAVGFPDLSAIGVPYPGYLYNELAVTRYQNGIPYPDLSKRYTVLVSKTDSDGNELAGIRVPDVAVPLGTYTSWNVRTTNHAPGDACYYYGSTFNFAVTKAERIASGDPRPSLQERYSNEANYVNQVKAAAQALVRRRLLLQEDVQFYVTAAQTQTVFP
jgi:hypothetical protein